MSRRILILALIVGFVSALPATAAVRPEARLTPPKGPIQVAFVLTEGATMIDFAGPWEVFQDVMVPGREDSHPFRLYTVSEIREPIRASAGMRIVPDHTFADAPAPRIVVIPAQAGAPGLTPWLQKVAGEADLIVSVCTGAFHAARAGLLDGRKATTHHDFYEQFQRRHPAVDVQRDLRWVEGRRYATAGGLTSGIDLALRIVARYFGEEVAERTAVYMEYSSNGWRESAGLWDPATDEQARAIAARRLADFRPPPALNGLDPVLLARGEEQSGRDDLVEQRGRYAYAFANEKTRADFLRTPEAYEIQFDGRCASMANAAAGSADPGRYLVHDRRIYIFASDGCREAFRQSPERFLN